MNHSNTLRLCAALTAALAFAVPEAVTAGKMPDVKEIVLPGEYPGHLQDVCWDGGDCLYWAHTWDIVKTDLTGKVLCHAEVEGHNAGCEVKDGLLYVAVCPTSKRGGGILKWGPESKLQVNAYDVKTLKLVAKHVLPINDRAGSLAVLEDGSFVVGCLRPDDITDSQVRFHHLSADFKLISTHLIDNMKIPMGIETIKRIGGSLYLMCYKGPTVRVDAKTFKETDRRLALGGQCGFVYGGDHYWRSVTQRAPAKGKERRMWHSKLVRNKKDMDFLSAPKAK